MKTEIDFDILNSPLAGTNLIEASAGTGKTYAVAGLFLRLILEKNLSANKILVVTFTEAATAELKHRIRVRLREATEAFSTGKGKDEFLNHLVEKIQDSAAALTRINEAIRIFDEAGIYTIHGFCRKMLYENAFESGSLFDTELVTDQESLIKEVIEDFWRMHFYRQSPLFVNYALHNHVGPDSLFSLFGHRAGGTRLKVIPKLEIPETADEERRFKEAFDEIQSLWLSAKAEIEDILMTDKGLNGNKYRKNSIPVWIREMDGFISSGGDNPVLFDAFKKFCAGELEESVKKNHTAPDHPFFSSCEILSDRNEDLQKIFEKRILGLKIKLFYYLRDELAERKQKRNVQFFDDLLLNFYKALEGKGGRTLSRNIRKNYQAALIDEFQDTDPVQYAILKRIFMTENTPLFLIGDPKQAIYGFRGADIFAYMDASIHAETRYTLKENWRSEPDLIAAINTVFENSDLPFVYDEIVFHRTAPAVEKAVHELLKIEGSESESPLQMWFLDAGKITKPGKLINKSEARNRISRAVSAEISRLIILGTEHKATVGGRPLRENDIAVLVRENKEAHMVQKALSDLNIPSVLYTTDNLFACHEALEMERVLSGVVQPGNERLARVALATDMMGVSGEQIDKLREHEIEWEKWFVKFLEYHQAWEDHGFMRMFKTVILKEQILPRLMKFKDGERRSTNLLHLSEVLHQAATEKNLGMTGLVKWLSEKRHDDSRADDEHQLRLESDEKAVKLVTIHRSKGLEYPVVFCPFSWGGSKSRDKKGPFSFHDKSDNMTLTLDLGSEEMEAHRGFAETEMLAENLRLLYVALTRARNRCYLVWGRFNQADTSALAYLFHQPALEGKANIVNATSKKFNSLDDKTFFAEIETLCSRGEGTIRLSEITDEAGAVYSPFSREPARLESREFKGTIDQHFRISSFSSLVSAHSINPDMADHDVIQKPDAGYQKDFEESIGSDNPSEIFSFPKGARAGTFMHDIFEHLDFSERNSSPMKELVGIKLTEYGFEPEWAETICEMIRNVLFTPLEHDQKEFTLSRIPNKERLNELGFYFPLKSISPEKLADIFERAGGSTPVSQFPGPVERLNFSPIRGFMKGFMDMVFRFRDKFYLVDWKSNFLGNRIEDYARPGLVRAIKENFYVLQYHIYAVALHQYLRLRLPDYRFGRHFGGVYYIFLRGVAADRGPDYGIFRDRPSEKLITDLCRELIDLSGSTPDNGSAP